jgi:beta-mannanase
MNGAGGSDPGDSPILEPEDGALLGLYYGDDSIADTAAKLGRDVPIHLTYYAWTDDWTEGVTHQDLQAGRIPLVNWELYDGGDLAEIVAGDHDDMLAERAASAAALGEPFFLDLGAEMNGDWSPWSGAENGQSADLYVAMYRHVHDALESAENVVWVWCPNVTDEPRASWNEALDYYPGDDYVDWTCVDGYNWGDTGGGGWQTFQEVFEDVYPKLASKGKPIMIGEMASAESGGDKAEFIDGMLPALRDEFPLIKALVWFDVNKETDWRVSSSPAAEAAFKAFANDAYLNP